jgi:hypothetical protein
VKVIIEDGCSLPQPDAGLGVLGLVGVEHLHEDSSELLEFMERVGCGQIGDLI